MFTGFEGVGLKDGLEIWRIENFEPVAVDPSDYGKFHEGDSYVLLRSYRRKDYCRWNIHFWLGRETTVDEYGAAAIFAVELDDSLGGAPVQYRELQEHESEIFLSYFPTGIRYLAGGVKSGLTHFSPDESKRLYQVKGKRSVRIRQVNVSFNVINKGDCFILDTNDRIFVYYGRNSNKSERLKAICAANKIRDQDHAGRSAVIILDEFSDEADMQKFLGELGVDSLEEIPDELSGGSDEEYEVNFEDNIFLYKVSDSSGELKIEKMAGKPLSRLMLKSDDCFILDTGTSGVFTWIGKGSTKSEKEKAMRESEEFIKQRNYPNWVTITRVVEGGEPSLFKEYFNDWTEDTYDQLGGLARSIVVQGPDDETVSVEMYRIENCSAVKVDAEEYGTFRRQNCYIVKHVMENNPSVIYCWMGQNRSRDDEMSGALQALELGSDFCNTVVVRVTDGFKPPICLSRLFNGKMAVFSEDQEGVQLFRIHGTSPDDVMAIQIPAGSGILPDDVILIKNCGENYLWFGKESDTSKREVAKNHPVVSSLGDEYIEIEEGAEEDQFFDAVGGREFFIVEVLEDSKLPPLLYRMDRDGLLIKNHEKKHLKSDGVFLLKHGKEAYLWFGRFSKDEDRIHALCRETDKCDILFINHQGYEYETFKSCFPKWVD